MDLQEFKEEFIKKELKIDVDKFNKIYSFVDFGNVNHWFDDDDRDGENNILLENDKLDIDLKKLYDFISNFSNHIRFYYGHNSEKEESMKFLGKTKYIFGKKKVFTKPIQKIKHYLKEGEGKQNTRNINKDKLGEYIYLPKCNFDVEICVDAIRLMSKYDTFCIFTSDSDFVSLIKFLKNNRKKVILIKSGFVQHSLVDNSDLVINAQDIKKHITFIKQKSSPRG